MVGKLTTVDLREIWKHEAYDFTSWLFENCDVLNDQIGLTLKPIEKEKSVGTFFVDIYAEDDNGRLAIIENQLTKTDHDHLGKLLTYLSNLDAKIAVWVSTDPRPEHVSAINYLNEVVPEDTKFYLLKVQAFRIGDSEPAPLFTVEAGPSNEIKARGVVKKDIAQHDEKWFRFFGQLLVLCNERTNLFANVSPVGYQGWIVTGAGKSGLSWLIAAGIKKSRIDFCLSSPSSDINSSRFKYLASHKDSIEKSFGEPLVWDFKENRKQHAVRTLCTIGGMDDEEKWPAIHSDLVDRIVRFEKALRPFIKDL